MHQKCFESANKWQSLWDGRYKKDHTMIGETESAKTKRPEVQSHRTDIIWELTSLYATSK